MGDVALPPGLSQHSELRATDQGTHTPTQYILPDYNDRPTPPQPNDSEQTVTLGNENYTSLKKQPHCLLRHARLLARVQALKGPLCHRKRDRAGNEADSGYERRTVHCSYYSLLRQVFTRQPVIKNLGLVSPVNNVRLQGRWQRCIAVAAGVQPWQRAAVLEDRPDSA